jgi:hypothetical protein
MAFYTDWVEKLQATRTMLADNVQINNPENYSKLTGALNALFSPVNPTTIQAIQQENSANGKYRPVQIKYEPHWGDENVVTSDASDTCDPVDQRRSYIDTIQPSLYVSSKATLDEDYLRQSVEDPATAQDVLNTAFGKAMRVGREKMNDLLLAKLVTKIGSNPAQGAGTGSYTTIEMINADGSLNVDTFDQIKNDMEDNFMTGTPSLIGLGNIRKVFNRFAVGNLNTSAGIDFQEVAQQFGSILFKDQSILAQLGGANRVLAMYPGMQQFFSYNLFKGFFAQNVADLRIKGTMPDPIYPFEWDYILEYDDNCSTGNGLQGAWTIRCLLSFDVWTVPSDAFGDTYGDLNDFTGIVGYNITQGS